MLITVPDIKTALRLEMCGFSYTTKKNKKKKLYCFQKTDELMAVLNQSFKKEDYFEDKFLTF